MPEIYDYSDIFDLRFIILITLQSATLWGLQLLNMYRYRAQSTFIVPLVINVFSTFVLTAAATGEEVVTVFNLITIFAGLELIKVAYFLRMTAEQPFFSCLVMFSYCNVMVRFYAWLNLCVFKDNNWSFLLTFENPRDTHYLFVVVILISWERFLLLGYLASLKVIKIYILIYFFVIFILASIWNSIATRK